MSAIKIEAKFKDLLPPLSEEQKEELEKDIIKNGCLTPLVIWDGVLIDGHHRYEICTKNNIPFDVTVMHFENELEAMEWSWGNQKNRRNLTKYDLAQIALKFKPVIEAKAKENQKEAGKNYGIGKNEKVCQISAEAIEHIDTKKELAKLAGVSHDTIHKVEFIEEKASNDIKKQVKAGEITINSAYILTKSAIETKKQNEENERLYAEQLEKENKEREEKERQVKFEKALPENTFVLDKFRKPKETHIFGIEDFDNLTSEQLDSCIKHTQKYHDAISKLALLNTDNDSLRAWNCVSDTQEIIDIELNDINAAIQKLIAMQNYFKGVRK